MFVINAPTVLSLLLCMATIGLGRILGLRRDRYLHGRSV
jgi:hypothetical protein